ncbi:MAG: 4Fe-4S binding protein [Candidatus Eisenbacteria bacterium]
MKTRYLRYGLMGAVLVSVIYLALGFGSRSFEAYCPFGGMESLWGLWRTGEFSCALGPLNLSMFLAVLVLALAAKKAFCGWACPIGFLGELTGRLGGLFRPGRRRPNPRINDRLKLLRYAALVASLYFTYKLGELVLRGFDPFYAVFSGFGHGTLGWITYATLGAILAGSLVVPMFFCRYLCPLGATFDPISRLGFVKIVRDSDLCTACADCGAACPHDIRPYETKTVRDRDCTNCLECIDACPVKGALNLRATL